MKNRINSRRRRWLRRGIAALVTIVLAGGVTLVWPGRGDYTLIGVFSSAVGIYPGDDVRIIGVPVGKIDSIRPQADAVKITMTIDGNIRVPADAKAIMVAPNLVSARFIQLAPAYTHGPKMAAGTTIGLSRTGVPVEWDDVKKQLSELTSQLGPHPGKREGPLNSFINQAADTFDGNSDSFRNALKQLTTTAGRLGDSRNDLFGTIKNLQALVAALADSNEHIVQFGDHLASVTQVLAQGSRELDATLSTLNQALVDVKDLLHENNTALIDQVNKLTDFTTTLTKESRDIEQVLHVAPNGIVNFYNMYSPAQGSVAGLVSLPEFGNPVQFICGGVFEANSTTDNLKRAEICRERLGPVLKRLAVNYPPFLFHPINSITAYKGQIIYDTPATQAKVQTPVGQLQWLPRPQLNAPKVADGTDLGSLLLPPAALRPPDGEQSGPAAGGGH